MANEIIWYNTNMTSNTTPIPLVASASSIYDATYPAWKAFNGTYIDRNDTWHSASVTTAWLQLDFGIQKKVNTFKLKGRPTANPEASPNTFKLLGSNDGVTYVEIFSTSNVTWIIDEEKTFSLSKDENFRYYKLDVAKPTTGTYVIVGMLLFGFEDRTVRKILLSSGDGEILSFKNKVINSQPNLAKDVVKVTAIGGLAPEKTIDGVATTYGSGWYGYQGATSWLKYEFNEEKCINQIKILSYYHSGVEALKDFQIEGSNTGNFNGEQSILYTGQHPNDTTNAFFTYDFENYRKYKFYRINILSIYVGNGANDIGIQEVEFRDANKLYIASIGTSTEKNFINHGTDKVLFSSINPTVDFTEKHYIKDTSTVLGSGKVFEHVLDVDKVLKKVMVK